jgi:hypothetical protein
MNVDWGLYQVTSGGESAEHRLLSHQETSGDGDMPTEDFVVLNRSTLQPIFHHSTAAQVWPRSLSHDLSSSSHRTSVFTERIRARDGGCCITGETPSRTNGRWTVLQAAHIFPRAQLDRVSTEDSLRVDTR